MLLGDTKGFFERITQCKGASLMKFCKYRFFYIIFLPEFGFKTVFCRLTQVRLQNRILTVVDFHRLAARLDGIVDAIGLLEVFFKIGSAQSLQSSRTKI